MNVSEIKCPHCGEWTMWQDNVDDRCINCGAFLDSRRFSREIEKKINKDLKKEDDYFALKPTDGPFTREVKSFFNSLRWAAYYIQLIFFAFITLLLVLVSIITG